MKERTAREQQLGAAFSSPANTACDAAELRINERSLPGGQSTPALQHLGGGATIYVPEHYESNYAYPLIAWLESGASAPELLPRMCQLSSRNYLALSVAPSNRRVQSDDENAEPPYAVGRAIAEVCERYTVHEDRVYIAGFGSGATAALHLLLAHPDWFRGAICLGGGFPAGKRPFRHYRQLRRKRVFASLDVARPRRGLGTSIRTLHSTGIDVHVTAKSGARMLREVDSWIMGGMHAIR